MNRTTQRRAARRLVDLPQRGYAALLIAVTMCGLAVASSQTATGPRQGQKLFGIGEVGDGNFGISVALSARGKTAFVGGSGDTGDIGAAWAFIRAGSTWRQESRKLTPSRDFESTGFGLRVALSADGNTALIGGPLDHKGSGAAWIFTRSGRTWRQVAKLVPKGRAQPSSFGESVALSADGGVALVGGPTAGLGAGAAWAFTRSGSTWNQNGTKLTGVGEAGPGRFGVSLALSGNGRTALVGAPLDENGAGAVWIFTRTGSTWAPKPSKLTIEGGKNQAQFGSSIALSDDGNTALVGAPVDDDDVGTAWVFRRSGSDWHQDGKQLSPSGKPGTVQFGSSVALSGTGQTALVGGPNDNGDVGVGAAWILSRHGSTWKEDEQLGVGNGRGRSGFGSSVAISTDGSTALVGGYYDDGGMGAAWIYHL